MSSDAIQVDAEIVEAAALSKPEMPVVAFHPAEIDADFDAMLDWAVNLKTVYEAAEFTEDEQGYREAKAARAAIRTYIKEIDGRRKAVKAEYSAPLVTFEARVKLVTGALGDAADACDAFAKGWEDAGKRRKYDAIRAEYEDFAPMLAPVLPFDRFYDLMQQRGRKWGNAAPKLPKCCDEMREDVERVAGDWEAVKAMQTGHPDVAEREFFRTLDLGQAMRAARAADEEDARIAALKAEQERMRQEAEAARREREELQRQLVEASMLQPSDVPPAPTTPPVPPEPVPYAPPAIIQPPVFDGVADCGRITPPPAPEPTSDWVIVLSGVTEAAARRLLEVACDMCGGGAALLVQGSPMDAAIHVSMNARR